MVIVEYCLLRAILALLHYTPLPAANAIAHLIARVFDRALPKLRRVAVGNLELAGFGARPDIVDGVFESLARLLVAFAKFPSINRRNIHQWIRYEGLEHYQQAKQRGRGVLFATAHLGNWELSAFAHAVLTEPMNVLVRPLDNSLIDEFVERRRALSGNRVITKKDAARTVLKALKNNEAVGILVDQNSVLNEGVFVDFFGVPACTNAAFVRLAAHSGAAVIPGFALWSRDEGRYVLRFLPPIEMTGDAQADTQRLHTVIEQIVRAHPDQWLWIHRRWKTRPPGDPPLY
jgi:KDO2-lipid IV(A) lauroyltransferase